MAGWEFKSAGRDVKVREPDEGAPSRQKRAGRCVSRRVAFPAGPAQAHAEPIRWSVRRAYSSRQPIGFAADQPLMVRLD
jgi:hypothetical protein